MHITSSNITVSDFESLFKEHYAKLCNVAFKIVGDKYIAEDIVQDVFLKIWEKKSEINISSNTGGYFYKMVCNTCLNHIGKKKVINFSDASQKKIDNYGKNNYIEANIDFSIFEKTVNNALDNLPPKCKAIFILSRFENLKYKDIALQLDISIKTVESQMGIAIKRLNTDLKPILMKNFPDIVFSLIILIYAYYFFN